MKREQKKNPTNELSFSVIRFQNNENKIKKNQKKRRRKKKPREHASANLRLPKKEIYL